MTFLIVGLGNPGKKYIGTRHNIGFDAVMAFARQHHLEFRKSAKFKCEAAEGRAGDAKVILLMPQTYMNLSGESVGAVFRYLQLEMDHLLVIVDDVAIPFGQLRLKSHSSSGGHNGLKSVEAHLQSTDYARLRIGVGESDDDLSEYVLGKFSEEERKRIPEILDRSVKTIEIWLKEGLTNAMNFANIRPDEGEGGIPNA